MTSDQIARRFEDGDPCDGFNCRYKITCARWIVRCALTWHDPDGKPHVIGLPLHNAKPWPQGRKCPFWLAIPNDKYPAKDDVHTP